MRVSQQFGLTGSQGSFDFVDVNVDGDTALFIDPAAIASLDSAWTNACTAAVQSYFQQVLDLIIGGDQAGAVGLLGYLGEENATHLGYSSSSRGSGVGDGLAERFYDELSTSSAVASGLITDLEDTALLIVGVREDRISDVTTNIIRQHLVTFTQAAAEFYGIPLDPGVAVGPYWDLQSASWKQELFDLPVTPKGPLLLVPKSIVRKALFLDPDEYYRHYILEHYRQVELGKPSSPLTFLLKSGQKHVYKKDIEKELKKQYPSNLNIQKNISVDGTQSAPGLIGDYKDFKNANPATPVNPKIVADATGTSLPDFDGLLAAVLACTPGAPDADVYERAVESLLAALFYPALVNPIRQHKVHDGRKRIDISFTNAGNVDGFFAWVAAHFPAANVAIECKNYSRPLANPEFDQISSRFSPSRGRYGLLVYRGFDKKEKVLDSLRDTARDDRGWVTALDDDDLGELVVEAKDGGAILLGGLLHTRFEWLNS